jgi:hypothetical protein
VRHLDGTRLRVILRDRASGQALWEGRADNTEKSGSREASADLLAPRMAHALFTGFPAPRARLRASNDPEHACFHPDPDQHRL